MKTSITFGILMTACAVLIPSHAADWSDTEIQLLHGSKFHEPGNTEDVVKSILTLKYASGYAYGDNYFFFDVIQSNASDNNSGQVYGEYYHTLSVSKLRGIDWSKDTIKDIGVTAGINFGAKNDAFGANARVLLLGPTFDFNVPGFKFFSVDVLSYRDSGRSASGANLCGNVKTTYQITPAWNLPFSLGEAKFSFEGFVDFIGNHGTCTKQTLAQPQLRWDVGNHMGKPDTVFVGIEYQYWKNKFGNSLTQERFPQLLLAWKM